ncbi:putative hydro-lyase [Jiella sp. MQZ9-1]|uniref:Putative hydro-lyase J1C48_08355 n=1 Tax=Jiella flava TaxID=2816857 RepID=A0A939JTX4_9HYPH|nr:putative hydro-lyase [Jiella flava]MBO0662585.1 putative hydro-lyase [Jiella flava]MCD2472956.1 putative hydro-lyase [Jiella flava]
MTASTVSPVTTSPAAIRRRIRSGAFQGHTGGQAPGYLQGNLAILPEPYASDFLRFCVANPKPCPLLGVGEPGNPHLVGLGEDLDIRTDVPRYRIFRDGELVDTVSDLCHVWRDDLVAFAIGCSFSFEDALLRAGIRVPHIAAGRNVPMYATHLETNACGPFAGPMVVSMRAFKPRDAIRAMVLSERQPLAHGAPLHFGDPAAIGIADIMTPDFGDPPVMADGEVPVFWACGVTPQLAIRRARPEFAITHDPGHMLITDRLAEQGA